MDIHLFDIIVGTIILLLGLKGILNGFFKELFGLIGIIGGIFIASRYGENIGTFLNDLLFGFESASAVTFAGFLMTLAFFWIAMVLIGMLFKKISKESGLGPVDKIFGFLIGSGKFFLIASVIIFAANNIKALQNNLGSLMQESLLFPVFVEVGDFIMHVDPATLQDDGTLSDQIKEVEKSIDEQTDAAKKSLQDNLLKGTTP